MSTGAEVIRPRKKHPQGKPDLPRYDQALRAAKNANRNICLTLAVEMPYADEDCQVVGKVLEVDKYDILLSLIGTETVVWFKKSAIVATEVIL